MTGRSLAARPLAWAAAVVFLWPVIELAGAALGARHSATQVVWLRYAVHLLLLALLCLPRAGIGAFATGRPLLQLLRGGFMFGMPWCFLLAQARSGAAWTWMVFWLAPLLALAAAPLLGERPRPAAWIAAGGAWVGAAVVLRPPLGGPGSAVLALAMAGTFAGYIVASRALAEEQMPASLFYTGLGALLPMSLLAWPAWTPIQLADAPPLLALGSASLACLFALDRALELAPIAEVAPVLIAVVAWEALLHAGLRRELPGGLELAGMAVILGSAALLPALGKDAPSRARQGLT